MPPSDYPDFGGQGSNPPELLDTVTVNAGGPTVNRSYQLPAGAHGVAAMVARGAPVGAQLAVAGHTTGKAYLTIAGAGLAANDAAWDVEPVLGTLDSQLDVSYSTDISGAATFYLLAVYEQLSFFVKPAHNRGSLLDYLQVGIMSPGAGLNPAANSLSVVLASDSAPFTWQVPTASATVDWGAGAGGSLTVVPAVAGKTIRVFALAFWFDTTGAAGSQLHLEDTNGGQFWKCPETATAPPTAINLGGFPLLAGLGLKLVSDAAVAVRGVILYSQA